ncbi:hypothetical protein ZWY2020_031526 [Hordeum vulgare]|nr:hypothetical protein ZWY2020_031526 [Hordeum vulgare]
MSSMMERLRSLGLYRFRSDDFPPEYNYSHLTPTHRHQATRQQSSVQAAEEAASKTATRRRRRWRRWRPRRRSRPVRRLERLVPTPAGLVQRRRGLRARCVEEGEAAGRGAAGGRVRGREGGRLHQQVPIAAAATEAQLAAQLQGDAQPRRIADADQHNSTLRLAIPVLFPATSTGGLLSPMHPRRGIQIDPARSGGAGCR